MVYVVDVVISVSLTYLSNPITGLFSPISHLINISIIVFFYYIAYLFALTNLIIKYFFLIIISSDSIIFSLYLSMSIIYIKTSSSTSIMMIFLNGIIINVYFMLVMKLNGFSISCDCSGIPVIIGAVSCFILIVIRRIVSLLDV